MTGILQAVDRAVRQHASLLIVLLLTLVGALPIASAVFQAIAPALPFIAFYALLVERPKPLSRSGTFVAGLFQDLLFGRPAGLSALLFLAVREAVLSQRQPPYVQSLWRKWGVCALAAIAQGLALWVFMSAWRGALLSVGMTLLQALAGMALFPWLALMLRRIEPARPQPA